MESFDELRMAPFDELRMESFGGLRMEKVVRGSLSRYLVMSKPRRLEECLANDLPDQ